MPTPGRVIGDVRGKDDFDTAARQYAALMVLSHEYLDFWFRDYSGGSGNEGGFPKAVRAKRDEYGEAAQQIAQRYKNQRQEFVDLHQRYHSQFLNSPLMNEFRKDIYTRFLSPKHWDDYTKENERRAQAAKARAATQSNPPAVTSAELSRLGFKVGVSLFLFVLSVIMFVLAVVFGLRANKARALAEQADWASLKDNTKSGCLQYVAMGCLVVGMGFLFLAMFAFVAIR